MASSSHGEQYPELGWRVLDAAPVLILVLDADGAIQHVNPYFERLTGYGLDEIRGKDWFEAFVPERERARIRGLFKQVYTGAPAGGGVSPIVTRAGEERQIEWTDELLRDGDGHATAMLAIGRDVTARNAAQDALRESEQRLAEAHRLANIGAWEVDLETSVLWWSDEQHRMFGIPVGTPVTRELFRSLIHPEDRVAFEETVARTLAVGGGEIELRIVRPDGEVRTLLGRAKATFDANGKPIRMSGTNQDVTARTRTETALRESERRNRTIVEHMPDPLVIYDLEGRIQFANPAFAAMVRRSSQELVGKHAHELWPKAVSQQQSGEMFQRAITLGERQNQEIRSELPDGRSVVRELNMIPLVGGDDRVTHVLAMSRDITAQRQLVDGLRDADRRKNEFIAMLSHELRNPLSAIRGGLHVLDGVEPGSEPARRATGLIDRQVSQLARLVDDLLDISRITQNKIQLQSTWLDVDRLVSAVVDDHRALFAERDVRLALKPAGGPVMVYGDAVRLTQVIGNLLHNAAKFTPSGGQARVEVSVDAAAGRGVIRVVDSGAGIDPPMIDRLFQPFAQADRTLARSMGGLGLGLTLVKGLVELHGGDVHVTSGGGGQGAEFIVRLPLEQPVERPIERSTKVTDQTPRRRVLVIEDNVDVATALRMILEVYGHDVRVAHTGPDGIALAREFLPDFVLSDLGLPGMDGYEVGRAFKHDDRLSSATLVAVSGYAAPDDVAQARAAGFDDHLAKPLDLERLRHLLHVTPRRV